jgi:hypothetical protein
MMKRLSVFFLMFLTSASTYAQISTPPLNCTPSMPGKPTFSVEFQRSYVNVVLKGNSYRVPFDYVYVDGDGDRWTIYQDRILRVSTTLPGLNLVGIQGGSASQTQTITSGKCF